MSKVSFTVRRPTPSSQLTSTAGTPVAGSPRLFSSRNDSDDDDERGIIFENGSAQDHDEDQSDHSSDDELASGIGRVSVQRVPTSLPYHPSVSLFGIVLTKAPSQPKTKAKNAQPQGPLIIPAMANPDWREAARRRRRTGPDSARSSRPESALGRPDSALGRPQSTLSRPEPEPTNTSTRTRTLFVPDSARAGTGADGSVGGLGTRDAINAGPQLSGLQLRKRVKIEAGDMEAEVTTGVKAEVEVEEHKDVDGNGDVEMPPPPAPAKEEETDDQRALRALLAGDDDPSLAIPLAPIPTPAPTESDAYLQDVEALPDAATLDDYARVPIAQFGAAMLRGMGWVEGTVASNSARFKGKGGDKDGRGKASGGGNGNGGRTGMVEPYVPAARPALLGIGAKEREAVDDGSTAKEQERAKRRERGDAKRYVPIVKREGASASANGSREASASARREASARGSRRTSRSPRGDRDRTGDRDRDGRKDYDGRDKRDRSGRHEDDRDRRRNDDRDRRRDDDRDRRKEYRDDGRDRRRDYDDRDRASTKERERDRASAKDRDRASTKERDRESRRGGY
ncbi:DExH-box splicing factor binding site-domain-containing protein [Hygrophoropsis aurantiaca]|uniref:DExH-box splicing factor binding site-domain-containing protein n=1 Tax=Hygrophoropsis aurantiaca TaxID=72124 RepID=A0ACB8APZ0_9AGAM|nr:DExH-box splicing factor binding site-domain-containing protein [Hygrophoropsis aurantiaca]